MGIRINKVLGWGLCDVQTKETFTVTDPRFSGLLNEKNCWDIIEGRCKAFAGWIRDPEKHQEAAEALGKAWGQPLDDTEFRLEISWLKKSVEKKDHYYCYDPEYGDPSVIVFLPIETSSQWWRHDDTIDYYEAGEPSSNVKPLTRRCGIYPFLGMCRIPNTGPSKFPNRIGPADYNQMVGRWDKDLPPLVKEPYLTDLKRNYRPVIPTSILLWTYYVGIFANWEKTVQELRPMIYTFWG